MLLYVTAMESRLYHSLLFLAPLLGHHVVKQTVELTQMWRYFWWGESAGETQWCLLFTCSHMQVLIPQSNILHSHRKKKNNLLPNTLFISFQNMFLAVGYLLDSQKQLTVGLGHCRHKESRGLAPEPFLSIAACSIVLRSTSLVTQ